MKPFSKIHLMKNIQFLVLFISITTSPIFSQIISENDIKIYEEADILMEKGQFSEALPIYLRLVKKDSINPDLKNTLTLFLSQVVLHSWLLHQPMLQLRDKQMRWAFDGCKNLQLIESNFIRR